MFTSSEVLSRTRVNAIFSPNKVYHVPKHVVVRKE